MSTTTADTGLLSAPVQASQRLRRVARVRRFAGNAAAALLSALIIVWTVTPIYNMVMVALESEGDVFSEHLFPPHPSASSFWVVLSQGHWYLEFFWHQFGNSVFIAVMVTLLVLLIGSLTSFSVGRMRIRNGWLVTNAALLTYVIPASFLAIPFYLIMQHYGLNNNRWSVIAALVTFATPYAIFIFSQYGKSIPMELDESARIDGANPLQIYFRIYLPLMAPALVAVGTYALLLAWNEYLYNFLLLSTPQSMTVAVALAQFLNSDESPWNFMMATAIIYALPPIILYYGFRRYMAAGLTMGGVKG
jgi:multiple sugar transport system permease protein